MRISYSDLPEPNNGTYLSVFPVQTYRRYRSSSLSGILTPTADANTEVHLRRIAAIAMWSMNGFGLVTEHDRGGRFCWASEDVPALVEWSGTLYTVLFRRRLRRFQGSAGPAFSLTRTVMSHERTAWPTCKPPLPTNARAFLFRDMYGRGKHMLQETPRTSRLANQSLSGSPMPLSRSSRARRSSSGLGWTVVRSFKRAQVGYEGRAWRHCSETGPAKQCMRMLLPTSGYYIAGNR
ncbi:hypothetical protein VTO73DRAFT_12281 [Trametes versicolor]